MASQKPKLRAVARATALLALAGGSAFAQQTTLKPVTVTGTSLPPAADITGFGDVPLKDQPISATVIDRRQIESSGARRLADLTRFEASATDAYNAPGYWDFIAVRGFILDNRYNFRREGLPITTETAAIGLENKERVEILRGTSGIQAGTSAPGGLVNYVVKRPTETDLREVRLEYTQRANLFGAVDLGGRFGTDNAFGYRLNVAAERLRPRTFNLDGERNLFALAADWRISRDSLLEAEIETGHRKQPSQVGFSLLGNTLPAVPDPRLNLNNQPWAQPSKFDALMGTLRFTQALGNGWKWSLQAGTERLKSDDFTAFPFGCSDEGHFDRYCSNGTFDDYDYRSQGETRRQNAVNLKLTGRAVTGSVTHDLSFGLLSSKARDRLPPNAYNWVGVGNVNGTAVVPPDPTLSYPGVARDERSTEFSVQDAMHWTPQLTTWLGVRHTRLSRDSVATDGTGATSYRDSVTTPWLALGYQLGGGTLAYASWGQGVESQVVPNNGAIYANPGAVLPALKSRQWEVGLKGAHDSLSWQVDAFDIHRPMTNLEFCSNTFSACVGQFDGYAEHRGVEAAAQWSQGPWRIGGNLMLLDAKRHGSTTDTASNGKRPTNVPDAVARLNAGWKIAGLPGAELQGSLVHEGRRAVLADNSIMLPSWTHLDAGVRYERQLGGVQTAWSVGVDNLTDRRYWRESPNKFGHVYLYPGAPRTVRVTFSAAL